MKDGIRGLQYTMSYCECTMVNSQYILVYCSMGIDLLMVWYELLEVYNIENSRYSGYFCQIYI